MSDKYAVIIKTTAGTEYRYSLLGTKVLADKSRENLIELIGLEDWIDVPNDVRVNPRAVESVAVRKEVV